MAIYTHEAGLQSTGYQLVTKYKVKGAWLDIKRALARVLKSIFCNPEGRLLEAKRACIGPELYKNSLQTWFNKGISRL